MLDQPVEESRRLLSFVSIVYLVAGPCIPGVLTLCVYQYGHIFVCAGASLSLCARAYACVSISLTLLLP